MRLLALLGTSTSSRRPLYVGRPKCQLRNVSLVDPRHHLHRRDRQDRAQGGRPLGHARRLGRGRPAGAAKLLEGKTCTITPDGARGRPRRSSSRSTRPTSSSSSAAPSTASRRSSVGEWASAASASGRTSAARKRTRTPAGPRPQRGPAQVRHDPRVHGAAPGHRALRRPRLRRAHRDPVAPAQTPCRASTSASSRWRV